ncbi:MAG: 2-oxo acid dehydrogenase subunit E2 [Alphaproteobacteria bacterium]|nr:2-oxo acid dehydrogenase subunit E2 [Alphaproteobacteria bacterium]
MIYVLLVIFVVWALLSAKTSRPDGTLVKPLPQYRRMMQYIMPGRNESIVFFDRPIDATNLLAYLPQAKDRFDGNLTHLLVAACNIGLAENPQMNQFVMGRRLYARKGRWLTFSLKRKKLNRKAKLSAVKLQMQDGETFRELTERINAGISVERSGEKTNADKEYDLFGLFPRPVIELAAKLIAWLDYYNILPAFFIEGEGMYTSMFIANLGSLGMGAGYHHLYEFGSCPLFLMCGALEERAVVVDGEVVIRKMLPLRFSYDERISDGLNANYGIESVCRVLEDPFRWLGCVAEDGSDVRPMWPHGESLDQGDDADPGGILG